jgi:hypothetical protein
MSYFHEKVIRMNNISQELKLNVKILVNSHILV